jgi:hypothetical protein
MLTHVTHKIGLIFLPQSETNKFKPPRLKLSIRAFVIYNPLLLHQPQLYKDT